MSRITSSLRLLVVCLAALASVATSKVESGERGPDGECPAYEQCSDDTPVGLYFGGMPTGDDDIFGTVWPKATAIGGSQQVTLYLDADATQPLDLPFAADLSTEALAVAATGSSWLTVTGQFEGTAKLRITEPGSGLLYDRIDLEAAAIDDVDLVPSGRYVSWDLGWESDTTGLAVWQSGEARVTVRLWSSSGERVVDRWMQIDSAPGVSSDPLGFRDTVLVSPAGPNDINLAVTAGDIVTTVGVRVVASADRIVGISGISDSGVTVTDGYERTMCFRAESQDDLVMGGSWTYVATGPVSMSQVEDANGQRMAHCIAVTASGSGDAMLTASAAGASIDIDIDAVTEDAAVRSSDLDLIGPDDAAEPALPGERAHGAPM